MQTLSRASRVFVILFVVVFFAHVARIVVLPILVAWIGSMALKPPTRWLHEHHFPNYLAALIVVGIFMAIVCCGIYYLGRPAALWVQSAPETLPKLKQKYQSVFRHVAKLSEAASNLTKPIPSNSNTNSNSESNKKHGKNLQFQPPTEQPSSSSEIGSSSMLGALFTWTGSMAAGVGEAVALLFLFLAAGDLFTVKLVHVMPTLENKKRAVEITHEIQHGVSKYLFTVTLINLALGLLIGTALYFLGMPNAALWGAVATLLNFIPYFGPVIGMILVALAGLVSMDSVAKGLAPAGAYLFFHIIEADLFTPYALGHRFTLNPVVIFIFIIFCIWLWGLLGAFLAVPILVTLQVICERIQPLSKFAQFISR